MELDVLKISNPNQKLSPKSMVNIYIQRESYIRESASQNNQWSNLHRTVNSAIINNFLLTLTSVICVNVCMICIFN